MTSSGAGAASRITSGASLLESFENGAETGGRFGMPGPRIVIQALRVGEYSHGER